MYRSLSTADIPCNKCAHPIFRRAVLRWRHESQWAHNNVRMVSIACNKISFKEWIQVRFIIGIHVGCVENASFFVLVCYKKVRNEVGVKAQALAKARGFRGFRPRDKFVSQALKKLVATQVPALSHKERELLWCFHRSLRIHSLDMLILHINYDFSISYPDCW